MKIIRADIWNFQKLGHYIVIPTNGSVKNSLECVMGRGLAKQARDKFPGIAKRLGGLIVAGGNKPYLFEEYRIITFPVKHNWWELADLGLIEKSCRFLLGILQSGSVATPIYMPKVGTGNGRLLWSEVKPILEKYLDNRFIICDKL